ncbi:uncharacterized protein LOC142973573 isoform X2 [Anticarsia gemmatalis]|uniref:uncharacterized protein LOC142973573 isoform X2 n=1 Tax=Anticarsia gemmatalis TaxID=129554 RepID=UPI003F770CCC
MLMTKKTLFLYFSLLFLTICRTNDYCSPDFCNNSRQHTLCKYRSEDPAGRCLSYERTILNTMDRQLILDKINNRRNKVAAGEIRSLPPAAGMMKMVWNAELENSAQRWADQCVKHDVPDLKDSCRDTIDMRVGQNIATVQGDSPGLSPLALVDVWYMELLKINSSVISRYVPSSETGAAHYDYFTQLVWEESTDVGCGGVKFKERLDIVNYRTIYRLVCNFAPAGNRRNQTVYSCGSPCSGCPDGVCDSDYRALCEQKPAKSEGAEKVPYYEETSMSLMSSQTIPFLQNTTNDIHTVTDVLYDAEVSSSDNNSEKDSTFDYFPHLYNPKHLREEITASTKDVISKDALLNDFIELLKKKLTNDPTIKDLLSNITPGSTGVSDISFTDENVAAFVNRVYSKNELTTTTATTLKDYVNSTLLVDLIEAVIFRSNDKISTSELNRQYTQPLPVVKPVKVQAELAPVQQNREFTGHYFFPEEDDEGSSETPESYYDNTNLAQSDVEMEIENLKMSSVTKDFLDEIFESDTSTERESTTTLNTLSPDNVKLYKNGYRVMKKFLKSIEKTSGKLQIDESN